MENGYYSRIPSFYKIMILFFFFLSLRMIVYQKREREDKLEKNMRGKWILFKNAKFLI